MEDSALRKELAEQYCKDGYRLAWIERDLSAGLAEFKKALEVWPDSAQAHHQIGMIYSNSSELGKALEQFDEAARLAPNWGEAHLWRGNAFKELDRNVEAQSAYREAERLMPDDPRVHISLADCFVKLGNVQDAITSFRHGIALKPAYGEIAARMMLAETLRQNGQIKEALIEWETVANMKAVWDYEQGEPELARKLLAQFSQQSQAISSPPAPPAAADKSAD